LNPAEWLSRAARLTPRAPALLRGTDTVADYEAFAHRAAAIAGALRGQYVIAPGDRVAVFAKNATDYLEILYGTWWAGAVAVPINAKLHAREAAWIVENAGARLVFVSHDVGGEFAAVAPDCVRSIIETSSSRYTALYGADPLGAVHPMRGDEMVWLFYTSGTTGRPKGVMISSANIQAMALSYFVDVDALGPCDAACYAAPMSHGAGLYNFMHVLRGAPHAVPTSGGFDPAEILDLGERVGNLSMFAAPTMVRRLVDHLKTREPSGTGTGSTGTDSTSGNKGNGIKTIVYGGGPMYVRDIVEAVEIMGPRFAQIYGQGECPMAITALARERVSDRTHPRWRERLGSVGVAQSCSRVRITDEAGRVVPAGETGEIEVAGLAVMSGYWRNPEASAETLCNGWLRTGDIGAIDADGFVTLHDRSKDVIISGGTNIYPREVEDVLLMHPGVREAAVVGRAHPDWGEEVVAFVVPAEGAVLDIAALDAHCRERIARFKRPRHYEMALTLPKNNYGKVLKTALRAELAKRRG